MAPKTMHNLFEGLERVENQAPLDDVFERVGLLPDGGLYIKRESRIEGHGQFMLTSYVPANQVTHVKGILSLGRTALLSDAEFLDLITARFPSGNHIIDWLQHEGVPFVSRSEG
jgi:hypothetical protein